MRSFEIYFKDLNEDAQKNLLEEFGTTEEDENWETIPLATIDREEEEEEFSEPIESDSEISGPEEGVMSFMTVVF